MFAMLRADATMLNIQKKATPPKHTIKEGKSEEKRRFMKEGKSEEKRRFSSFLITATNMIGGEENFQI